MAFDDCFLSGYWCLSETALLLGLLEQEWCVDISWLSREDFPLQCPGGDQVLKPVHLLLPVTAFRPVAQELSAQSGTGGCEVISGQPEQLALVSLARLQR